MTQNYVDEVSLRLAVSPEQHSTDDATLYVSDNPGARGIRLSARGGSPGTLGELHLTRQQAESLRDHLNHRLSRGDES
ncbi:hypothetical protein [Halorussus marinus]|uniref:hypothetical protein n=1 Tax=Halorussus marinus TaxID=2505976 RepID=UPI0010931E71|nr:hypothetical protein [Halorussus marinus]